MLKQLEDALIKLEETSHNSLKVLEKERQHRIKITNEIEQTQQELEEILNNEEQMIRNIIAVELEKPVQIGTKFQAKLIKQIEVAKFKHVERTNMVDELLETNTNLRMELHLLEKQLQRSQAQVQDFGNQLSQKQTEFLDLQILQVAKHKELKELVEEVQEMKELLQKVKEIQFTLNKVIGKNNNNANNNNEFSKTNSTEEAFKLTQSKRSVNGNSLNNDYQQDKNEEFWYTLPPTPPLKLPRIK
ncbi:unnamed protein product (macronuclear) [Paramecium tetraurelia]|uniref:Uncharacterized protein n=1 Tax=Paramecium tetraurelia TaxID=5888 RepID=A0CBS9_PARTE|nr:uncharacterized protein GSPATT00037029001 [Paramecium tetraurelia]CAK68246.1 unnamed protein product [Paramecium tetraurelia]|eukprot:XP_001435643.1 hypothetical protein (macronuclear) [Paramecium tetraurelia strain d4-2]